MSALSVCFPFIGDSVGGSQISAITLIEALDRTRFSPRVVLHTQGPLMGYLEDRDIPFEFLPLSAYVGSGRGMGSYIRHFASTTPVLWHYLRRHAIALVHTQDGRMNQTWGLPARLAGIPFVWHQRSKYAPSRITHHTMALASRIACNSEFVRQGLPSPMRAKAVVVDNPFDTDHAPVSVSATEAPALLPGTKCVTFVGNMTAQKRPEVFLQTAAIISDTFEMPVQFLLFGRDRENLQPRLTALADCLGIADAIRFMGFHDPITPWLAASDLLLAPEVDDAFGRTLVEAMLAGTPVVASNSGGHKEIIETGRTGLLVPPDDARSMASAALSL
ncbi:MAG: glycosyltransferase, partial [Rhodospirillaceae bacterium]|nr:glycosyltransferase [Rhodospirillaceae bacterium]